ncbi:hypothetical protein HZB01_05130 [Candidatus Woesearchaeota archaeon]|nr:hypothetical protein [Candidatus Woesearchaeota archaeon]
MNIERIESKERESTAAQIAIILLSIAVFYIFGMLLWNLLFAQKSVEELTKIGGIYLGIGTILIGVILGLIKKGVIPEEKVTAYE